MAPRWPGGSPPPNRRSGRHRRAWKDRWTPSNRPRADLSPPIRRAPTPPRPQPRSGRGPSSHHRALLRQGLPDLYGSHPDFVARHERLGELDLVVLTAHRRRFLDTFGAVSGALKGGGVLLFHTPPLDAWRKERLGARWCKLLDSLCNDPRTAELVTVCREEDGEPQLQGLMDAVNSSQADIDRNSMMPNQEQAALLQTILKIRSSRPLLIFGRRGRGKSALLGMAAAVLSQKGCRIIVTSPSKDLGCGQFTVSFGHFRVCYGKSPF